MAHRRIERLNAQLRRELAERIRREVRDPRVGSVIVTDVRVTRDLSVARVFVRVPGSPEAQDASLAGLEAAGPYLRRSLGQEMRIRRVPELRFELDESLDRALRIESLLEEVKPEEGWGEGDPGANDS